MAVVAWAAAIAVFSSEWFSGDRTGALLLPLLRAVLGGASETTLHLVHAIVRKGAHVTEYAILSLLLVRAIRQDGPLTGRVGAWAVFATALFAVSDEIHQAFVPSRTAAPADVLFDVVGALLGATLAIAASQSRPRPARRAAA